MAKTKTTTGKPSKGNGKEKALLKELEPYVQKIRDADSFYGATDEDGGCNPFPSLKTGTTATSPCSKDGIHPEVVYYDWGANWDDRVKEIIPTPAVQAALKQSLEEATAQNEYWFRAYDKETIWPFLFVMQRRFGNEEETALINKFLPREVNKKAADWHQAEGQLLIKAGKSSDIEDIWFQVSDNWFLSKALREVNEICAKALYNKDGPFREILIACSPDSYSFMPLNYVLAKLFSPPETVFKIYASDEYSVVHDETHNIVFDNFWYFARQTAKQALDQSKNLPQVSPLDFDFTLGGLHSLDQQRTTG